MTYATADFTTVPNFTKIQTAIVTSVAQGYKSEQLTITTTPVSTNPTQVKIFPGPTNVPADENSYPQIALELQNATGFVSVNPSDTNITVLSTDPTIGQVNSRNTIITGQTYSIETLNTTYKAGAATITAVAPHLSRNQQAITTTGFTPSKLAVFCVPSMLPSDNATYSTIMVQLQDSQGRCSKKSNSRCKCKLVFVTANCGKRNFNNSLRSNTGRRNR